MNILTIIEAVVAVGGAVLMYKAALRARIVLRQRWGGQRNIGWMSCFRQFLLGAGILGAGVALLIDATWLLLISLAVGGEEVLESTFLLDGLRRGASIRLRP
ncbi:MAG TPA: hypothetical protein VH951_06135 [Dehalococcoidia bacterium]